jgi:hypothetical protein
MRGIKLFNHGTMKKCNTFLLLLVFVTSCKSKDAGLAAASKAKLQSDSIKVLQSELTDYKSLYKIMQENEDMLFDNADADNIKSKGFKYPYEQFKEDLEKRKELTPKPVLGGTMTLDNIAFIRDKWLVAVYSDGHVIVTNLLKYKIENGKIKWQLLDSHN